MKTYKFYGDSFTYGQDSGGDGVHDQTKTWPMFWADLKGVERHMVQNHAMPGHSNAGIWLDIFQDIVQGQIRDDSVVIVGLTNIWRDATASSTKPGYRQFFDNDYHSSNVHFIDGYKRDEQALRRHAEMLADEENWMLAAKNIKTALSISEILKRTGCEFYMVDVIMDWNMVTSYVPGAHKLFPELVHAPQGSDFYSYQREVLEWPLSDSLHFYEDGYKRMAEEIYAAMEKR